MQGILTTITAFHFVNGALHMPFPWRETLFLRQHWLHVLVIGKIAITTDRNYITKIGRFRFQNTCGEILVTGKDLTQLTVACPT